MLQEVVMLEVVMFENYSGGRLLWTFIQILDLVCPCRGLLAGRKHLISRAMDNTVRLLECHQV
jgi:hypothetical protein